MQFVKQPGVSVPLDTSENKDHVVRFAVSLNHKLLVMIYTHAYNQAQFSIFIVL